MCTIRDRSVQVVADSLGCAGNKVKKWWGNDWNLLTLLCVDAVAATVTSDGPNNVTATVNTNVTLTCAIDTADLVGKSRDNSKIRWTLDRRYPAAPVELFNGIEVNPKFSRFKVNVDEDTRCSELVIHNILYKDAGNYSCKLISPGKVHPVHNFTLTVIG